MRRLCEDIAERSPAFSHVDMSRVLVAVSRARKRVSWGIQASLTPLRFENGATTTVRGRTTYRIERVVQDSLEMRYILSFYLPRFQDQTYDEKLITVFHELWHISPRFNGDIRRHAGRYHVHTHSQQEYDQRMAVLARQWLDMKPPADLVKFLKLGFEDLCKAYGPVRGTRSPKVRLLPVKK
jgi:predicted metallopeptidase